MFEGKKSSAHIDHSTITLKEIMEKGYSGRVIRYWLLSHHYRKSISFSWDKLEKAKNTIDNLDQFILKLHSAQPGGPHPEMDQLIYDLRHGFIESMDDDLNIAPALAVLFHFIREINRILDHQGLSAEDKENVLISLNSINSVLEVMDLEPMEGNVEIEALVKKREKARKIKDWAEADQIRQELRDRGIEVIDTKDGSIWRKI
jgi:cysteinyl-tRNA synthetase